MDGSPPGRWKRGAALALLLVLFWGAMFVGTHVPARPRVGPPTSFDKVQHASAFAVLAVLLCIVGAARGMSAWPLIIGVLTLIALYGAFDELTQAFVRNREPDLYDWLADLAGALLGIAAYSVARQLAFVFHPRRSSTSQP